MNIEKIEPLVFNVSEKTNWFFIRIHSDNGLSGIGEASLNAWEIPQIAYAHHIAPQYIGQSVAETLPKLRVYPHSPGGLVASSIISAMEQACTDLLAQHQQIPIHALLGTAKRKAIPVYANINRGARDRTPEGIAMSARQAVASGIHAVKIAPFDGVYWMDADRTVTQQKIQLGIDRIYAIREAVGPDIKLMVDCHWRFNEQHTLALLHKLQSAKLYWLECPTSESADTIHEMPRIRQACHDLNIKLSGAERQIGEAGFNPFISNHWLDVVMPDIKYAGGYAEMLQIAKSCEHYGLDFSPHNPTGPICNLASMHVCAVAPAFSILEHQLAESPLYDTVVGGMRPQLVNGCFVMPEVPGLGVQLDDQVLSQHPYQALTANANLDARLG